MKSVLTILSIIMVSVFLSSCRCNLDCPDCETLDEENCDCYPQVSCLCRNGVLDEGEEGIDCGGKCAPCIECLSEWCVLLSGGTSDQEPPAGKLWIEILKPEGRRSSFKSNGTFYETRAGASPGSGFWTFDDPEDPSNIQLTYKPSSDWPDVPYVWTIMQLTSDTLKIQNAEGFEYLYIYHSEE